MLGFEIFSDSGHRGGDDPYRFHWVWLRCDEAQLMLNTNHEVDEARPAPPTTEELEKREACCLYMQCSDVDVAHAELTAKGIEAEPPKVTGYGMKQLYFRDPDGVLLCLQQSVARSP